jgi:superfamily II DNA or RNA helicase
LEDTSQQGDAFERLTQLYLKIQPEYQSKLKNVWRWSEVPDEIRARLGLPATDEGIDILAETHQGDLWAIQCKFHSNPDRAVTRQELGTFVALASVAGLSQRVVVHTSSKPIRKRTLMGDTVEIGLDRWLVLDAEAWSLFTAALHGRAARPEPRLPRPHQQEALTAARAHYLEQSASRGRLIMPCGTGKSLTAFFIAEALDARNILVAVPSLALIRQSLADWTREYLARGEIPEWLCVCSDDSVGAIDSDSFVTETYDLGIPTTTSLDGIASFLAKPASGRRITFTTYQSSGRLAEAARQAGITFDLAVLDEAHRTVGAASKTFATLLRDDAISIEQRLFMTATERVLRGQNDDVLSMDDEGTYGERFFQLTFKDAIAQGIISDYKILTIMVSDEHVREIIRENRLLDLSPDDLEDVEAQAVATGIALKRVFQEHGISHAISFHRSIRAADRFREQQDRLNKLVAVGPETTNLHISSKKTAGQRAELLRDFVQHERAMMTNARCLTEGVDIPAIDCVLFADPKQSVVDIVQAAGRALRRSEGKECGYIILPLIVPSGVDLDTFAESTAFRQVARTITALSTQDERIAEECRAVEQGRQSIGRIVEIEGDVPVGLKLDLRDFAGAVSTRIWERVGRANWRSFEDARAYARSLKLKVINDWRAYAASGELPSDIPATPERVYAGRGWQGVGDWLGTGAVSPQRYNYRPFEDARAYVRGLGFKSSRQWEDYAKSGKRPLDIPAHPKSAYARQGWQDMGDWLGTGSVAFQLREYRSFEYARTFARDLGLKSAVEWKDYAKSGALPVDIPATPQHVYAQKGWRSIGDWLGTESVSSRMRKYRSFEEARAYVRALGLKSGSDWRAFRASGQLPPDIPATPNQTYADQGWQGMGDWLGTGIMAPHLKQFRPFEDARAFVRTLGLESMRDWKAYAKSGQRPSDIPVNPHSTYAGKGWQSMGDWLGTGRVAPQLREYRPFEEARAFVRALGFKSTSEWYAYIKSGALPFDIPTSPDLSYAESGWQGMGDWLGTGNVAPWVRPFRSFEEARAYVRALGLRSTKEWKAYVKSGALPSDIPSNPNRTYAQEGWLGIGDWIGTGAISSHKRRYRPFEEARSYARRLGLKTRDDWMVHTRSGQLPADIPANPHTVYATEGWMNTGDWLGTGRKRRSPSKLADTTSKVAVPSQGPSQTLGPKQTST